MNTLFKSVYGSNLQDYVALKQKLGYSYQTESRVFKRLDSLAVKSGQKNKGITQEFARLASERTPTQTSDAHHHRRVSLLRAFSSYLNLKGIKSYVPRLPIYRKSTFIPHIYTKKQISGLLDASQNLKLDIYSPHSAYFLMPVLFRVLLSTGIRIGEALNLKVSDFDGIEKLRVKDIKNGGERKIHLSKSLVRELKEYLKFRYIIMRGNNQGFFFVTFSGRKVGGNSVRHWLHTCLDMIGIACPGQSNRPRLHDMRHTFAVNSLDGMAKKKRTSVGALLLILMEYMGHKTLESTEYYLRMTREHFPVLRKKITAVAAAVFPKVIPYDQEDQF